MAAAAEASPPDAAPAKFSRYRSVRRAQAQHQQQLTDIQHTAPPVPPMEPQKDATVSRSMSRYHRRPTTSHVQLPVRSNTEIVPPPVPASAPVANSANSANSSARSRALSSPQHTSRAANNVSQRLPNTSTPRAEVAPLVAQSGREPSQTARDEAKQLLQAEAERQKRLHEKQKAEKRAKLEAEQAERERQEKLRREEEEAQAEAEAEAERLRVQREAEEAEQLRRQKEEQERGKRLQKAESAAYLRKREEARKAQTSPPTSPPRHGGGFGLFTRRRKEDAPTTADVNTERPRQTTNSNNRELDTIRPGGGGAVLGIDAPISAVNAGDRRVMIVCNKQNIYLPVTPATTALDLIKSASNVLTESIEPRTAVILESFQKVGVQRPLRKYEHVRDVMNSWDDDKQNDLVIVDSVSSGVNQQELLSSQVPDSKPEGMGCYLNYSSRPGKWSKRYITLRDDGQLLLAKSEALRDPENICHLSDFDIYTPTERKLAKVKPPKKICYAVKSQQKSNIFSDETRFVHFFCTNDKNTASLFYKALQGWRSWYLKHVMGEGQKKNQAAESKTMGSQPASRNVSGNGEVRLRSGAHTRGASVESHYQLGSFMPLLDLDQFDKDTKEGIHAPGSFPDDAPLAKLDTKTMHARRMSTRAKGLPPLSYNLVSGAKESTSQSSSRQNTLTQDTSSLSESETFSPGGLLGRNYSQRQLALQSKEQQSSGPFTEGPSLLNSVDYTAIAAPIDSGLNRRSSVRSNHHRRTSSDIQRSMSTRAKPKPLVDLTPQYREPPQHSKKGKGFHVGNTAGPLVDNATSPEEAIKVPSSTDWRSTAHQRQGHGTYGTGSYERTRSIKGRGEGLAAYTVNNHTTVPEDESNAFTGGLLARSGFSQGGVSVGHGVMDGSKARGPMLDMRDSSKFASGSLLAGVERTQGLSVAPIDRS